MEASTLRQAPALPKPRLAVGAPLLRFRSDEQLVAMFRAGHEDAFRAIHDRYHKRLLAYARQMLSGRQDAEDALQDVFVRAYAGLRASERDLALKAWLFRVAHNRCVDELRKPAPPPPEVLQLIRTTVCDPVAELDRRESLRRLVQDIRRLPEQQRSALLMRELGGMSYVELASSLGISVGAVKSLLVRARLALAQAADARETACAVIREQLIEAHDRGIRPCANTRKHLRDCSGCRSFRGELRGVSRQLAAFSPTLGPLGVLAKVLGLSGGGGAGGGALLGGGGATATAGGAALSTTHLTTLIVAAVATAGSAVEIQREILPQARHVVHTVVASKPARASAPPSEASAAGAGVIALSGNTSATLSSADTAASRASRAAGAQGSVLPTRTAKRRLARHRSVSSTATTVNTSTGSGATACASSSVSSTAGATAGSASSGTTSGAASGTTGTTTGGTTGTTGGTTGGTTSGTGSGTGSGTSSGSSSSSTTATTGSPATTAPATSATSPTAASPSGASGCGSTVTSSPAGSTSTGTGSTGATSGVAGQGGSSGGSTVTVGDGSSGGSSGTGSTDTTE